MDEEVKICEIFIKQEPLDDEYLSDCDQNVGDILEAEVVLEVDESKDLAFADSSENVSEEQDRQQKHNTTTDHATEVHVKEELSVEEPQFYSGGLTNVKQEDEVDITDDGAKDLRKKPQKSVIMKRKLGSKKVANDPKRCRRKSYQCSKCDYKSVKTNNLKAHIMAMHTGEKPHQCPHCDYRVVHSSHLKPHIMAHHTGEKPYCCPHCKYKTTTASVLKTHVMAHHTGEKPHQCPDCGYRAVKASNVKRHIKALHSGGKSRRRSFGAIKQKNNVT